MQTQTKPRDSLRGAANCDTGTTFANSCEVQRSDAPRRPRLDLATPRGVASCDTVTTFASFWEVQRSDITRTRTRPRPP